MSMLAGTQRMHRPEPRLPYAAEGAWHKARISTAREMGRILEEIRSALLHQRWADAVTAWMLASGEVLDGYPDEEVVTEEMLDDERASMEIRLSPVFRGQADP